MGKIFLILMIFSVVHARDPDALPRDYQYGEHQTVGGSKQWTGADTFVLCGVAVMVAMVFALPAIFDGEDRDWPVYKFRLHLLSNVNKFPGRRLCESY